MNLENKVAWITGAASGIGRATALLFARQGAKVALLDLDEAGLTTLADEITSLGGQPLPQVVNLRSPEQMESAAAEIIAQWERLDIVIANGGVNGTWAPIEDLSLDEWNATQEINLRGAFLTLKYAIPHLKKQGGSVVITSSVNGTRIFSNAGATAYSCSKAAQVALAKMAALELAEQRIRVNVICPGAIETDIDDSTRKRDLEEIREPVEFPEGKIPLTDGLPGTALQVADLMLFLASDSASHITGTEIWIDGAQSLLQG
ncbi:SDR family oxidoreductase [Blastopirellula marina]|uniref:Putative dehydrogenase, possibly 3-oxoacyl-[acyl-carrier protein] reductase n=1 Tax=Blastopirellula marina DSM 3645 TaxID=314230 RepID=A4A2X1_9BACT|nr:SDR family NAD(P)-dependent oxidoreductase [Blastopirellula marina]EAQ76888.1 putative dehydrogenase, possibly 3-oxoacyl-[acyl-carrier protein] reductase [Blastopirellula marina DSM 3645]